MAHLTRSLPPCPCGRPHQCSIRTVAIGSGALAELTSLCGEFYHILLVADTNTHMACGSRVASLLMGKVEHYHRFDGCSPVIPDEEAVAVLEACLTAETDLILGVGSGVINDLCKYVSHRHRLPYMIVATAPSMDG